MVSRIWASASVWIVAVGLLAANCDRAAAAQPLDVFQAIADGQIEVEFIAKNANEANLVVKNKTKQPLTVELPEVFGGSPVLAQFGDAGGDNQGAGGGNQGGPFNIAPEATRTIKAATLCLDHGKKDPNVNVKYELVPIEKLTDKPEVVAVLKHYVKGDANMQAAQAAVWHLQNGLSWEELAAKQIPHLRRPADSYFTAAQMRQAVELTRQAEAAVKSQKSESASSDSLADALPVEK